MQVMTLFYVSAAAYKPLTSKGGIHVFQFIYFFSSFWGQFGECWRLASVLVQAPTAQHMSLPAAQPQLVLHFCSLPVVQGLTAPLSCWLVSCIPLRCAQVHTAFLPVSPSLEHCGPPSTSTTWAAGRHLFRLMCCSS